MAAKSCHTNIEAPNTILSLEKQAQKFDPKNKTFNFCAKSHELRNPYSNQQEPKKKLRKKSLPWQKNPYLFLFFFHAIVPVPIQLESLISPN